jgi:non-specific serine/threonine protein kinase/serine/threonine-protein kinase
MVGCGIQTRSLFFDNEALAEGIVNVPARRPANGPDTGAPRPMESEDHDPVEMIVKLAGGMTPERRGRFLEAACGGDAGLRAEVETRLTTAAEAQNAGLPATVIEGTTDEIGETTPEAVESIALDAVSAAPDPGEGRGGDQADLAEGPTIDVYCDRERLGPLARLRLFQDVCRSVHAAHQRATIYGNLTLRDIHVGSDGIPRVSASGRENQAVERPLALDETSPEQVLGEPVTTATDVYALGVVLYRLLTGRSPYQVSSPDPAEIAQAISEQAPERPSVAIFRAGPDETDRTVPGTTPKVLGRFLSGDLDLIVLKAIQKEPERRYASAEQFADDIDRLLEGRPVRAHRGGRLYRAGKFLGRHPAAIAIGLLTLAALSLGLVATRVGLVRASRERDRAETAFRTALAAIDDLSSRVIEGHQFDSPGLEPARKALLGRILGYYENFLEHRGNDPALAEEEAEAWTNLAKATHLIGLTDEALVRYEQAAARWEGLARHHPKATRYADRRIGTLTELGELLSTLPGREDEARESFEWSRNLLEGGDAAPRKSATRRRELARVLAGLADIEQRQDRPDQAQVSLRRAIELLGGLVSENVATTDDQAALASALVALGHLLAAREGMFDQAVAAFTKGIDLRRTIAQEHPERVDQVHRLAVDLAARASLRRAAGQLDPAVEDGGRALEIFEQLDRRFPDHVPYQTGLYLAYDMMSRLRNQQGESAEALAQAERARAVLERLAAAHPRETGFQLDLARSHDFVGRLLRLRGKFDEAYRSFQRAVDVLEGLPGLDPAGSYQLAISLASCVSLVGTGPDTAPPDDESKLTPADRRRRELYGKRAVEVLGRAMAGGFGNLPLYETDRDLDPLRGRPDFQKLLGEFAEKERAKSRIATDEHR